MTLKLFQFFLTFLFQSCNFEQNIVMLIYCSH